MNDNPLGGILDITLPLAPEESGLSALIIVLTLTFLSAIFIGLVFYWWQLPRQRCTRKIDHLLHKHNAGNIDSHQAVFKLAKIMLERIRCQQLSGNDSIPMHLQQHHSRWKEFVSELDDARYSSIELSQPAFTKLAGEAIFWVRSW